MASRASSTLTLRTPGRFTSPPRLRPLDIDQARSTCAARQFFGERHFKRQRGNRMMSRTAILCCWITALSSAEPALAQVDLSTYADGNGYVDVQKLTCAQLANTFQEDADYLTVW